MEMLNNKGVALTTPTQKIFAVFLLAGVLGALYFILPPLVTILANLWMIIFMLTPLVLITLYCVFNPMVIWALFNNLSWKLTKFVISKDKIGMLERYHQYLCEKYQRLGVSRDKVYSAETMVGRQISTLSNDSEKISKDIKSLESTSNVNENNIKLLKSKLAVNLETLKGLQPRYVEINTKRQYLDELISLWGHDITELRYKIDAKIQEYQTYKQTAEALGEADEFIKGNTEASRIYNESLKQLEEKVTLYMANIDTFERKAQPLINEGRMKQTIREEEAKNILDEWSKYKLDLG